MILSPSVELGNLHKSRRAILSILYRPPSPRTAVRVSPQGSSHVVSRVIMMMFSHVRNVVGVREFEKNRNELSNIWGRHLFIPSSVALGRLEAYSLSVPMPSCLLKSPVWPSRCIVPWAWGQHLSTLKTRVSKISDFLSRTGQGHLV